jgi:preprotein translocase subunit SecG
MQHVIIVIHLMLVLAMIGAVLLQRSEGGGLGIGSSGGFMTSRGTANVLTRTTAILAGLFFATSLLLSILAGIGRGPISIIQGGGQAPASAPGAPAGSAPPLSSGGGVLNQLQGAPSAPATPSGPQVPQSR